MSRQAQCLHPAEPESPGSRPHSPGDSRVDESAALVGKESPNEREAASLAGWAGSGQALEGAPEAGTTLGQHPPPPPQAAAIPTENPT